MVAYGNLKNETKSNVTVQPFISFKQQIQSLTSLTQLLYDNVLLLQLKNYHDIIIVMIYSNKAVACNAETYLLTVQHM